MDFGLSEDQETLQGNAREVLARECPPPVVRRVVEGDTAAGLDLHRRLAGAGWAGILVPEAHGGLGLGFLDLALVLEELGRAAAPGPFLFSAAVATPLLVEAGSAAHRKRWLPRLASGETVATLAWTEPSDDLDPGVLATRARKTRGTTRLTGTKLFVPFAGDASLFLVAARATEGVSIFLVERDAPGIELLPLETIDRTRTSFEVRLDGVEVEGVLGKAGGGTKLLERALDVGAVALAADALGSAETLLERSVEYAREREQFGRPIGAFQAVKHMVAEMVAEIEPSRALVWYAAYALDHVRRDAARAASMAKARLSDVATRVASTAVQIHGGIGFTWEHDLHFWFKRARWNALAWGDASFHRERIARLSRY